MNTNKLGLELPNATIQPFTSGALTCACGRCLRLWTSIEAPNELMVRASAMAGWLAFAGGQAMCPRCDAQSHDTPMMRKARENRDMLAGILVVEGRR